MNKKIIVLVLLFVILLTSVLLGCEGKEIAVAKIAVLEGSFNNTYRVGETLNLINARLVVTYANGTVKTVSITEEMIEGFDSATTGEKTMDITYGGVIINYYYQVISYVNVETPVRFTLTEVKEGGNRFVDISITSIDKETVGVYAFSFEIAILNLNLAEVKMSPIENFETKYSYSYGVVKVIGYSKDGYTKLASDCQIMRIAIDDIGKEAVVTIQNGNISNGKKDMMVLKVDLPIAK